MPENVLRSFSLFVAQNVGLTLGTDLFVGYAPQGAQNNISTIKVLSGQARFWEPTRVTPRYQIISRGEEYGETAARAWDIFNFLNGKAGMDLPVVENNLLRADTIRGSTLPQGIGEDTENRHQVVCQYIVEINDLS